MVDVINKRCKVTGKVITGFSGEDFMSKWNAHIEEIKQLDIKPKPVIKEFEETHRKNTNKTKVTEEVIEEVIEEEITMNKLKKMTKTELIQMIDLFDNINVKINNKKKYTKQELIDMIWKSM